MYNDFIEFTMTINEVMLVECLRYVFQYLRQLSGITVWCPVAALVAVLNGEVLVFIDRIPSVPGGCSVRVVSHALGVHMSTSRFRMCRSPRGQMQRRWDRRRAVRPQQECAG